MTKLDEVLTKEEIELVHVHRLAVSCAQSDISHALYMYYDNRGDPGYWLRQARKAVAKGPETEELQRFMNDKIKWWETHLDLAGQ